MSLYIPDWQGRMPQQRVATHAHTGPLAVQRLISTHEVHEIIQDIWEEKLEGDIYADGEVWVDSEDLAMWRKLRVLETMEEQ